MSHKKTEVFYLIETVFGDGQYLCKVVNDENSYRPLIHGTSRDIHSGEVMRFKDLEKAVKVCKSLERDVHSDKPRVLRVSIKVNIQEVE